MRLAGRTGVGEQCVGAAIPARVEECNDWFTNVSVEEIESSLLNSP